MRNKKNGFTLVELLAVISIISILAILIVPRLVGLLSSSKNSALKKIEKNIIGAARNYAIDYELQPFTLIEIDNLCNGYIDCPINNPNTNEEISGCVKLTDNGNGNEFVLSTNPDECVAETVNCAPGTYLEANATSCTTCTEGYFCPGGTYAKSSSIQGRRSCPNGSYSTSGASSCTVCPNGYTNIGTGNTSCTNTCANSLGVDTWITPTISNGLVSNSCTISNCQNTYKKNENSCVAKAIVTLTVNLDGGTITNNPQGTYYEEDNITLLDPTKNDYEFKGWEITTGNSTKSGNKLTIGTTNTTIKASWGKPLTGAETLMALEGVQTTRDGCTGTGELIRVEHENGNVDYRYTGACPNNYATFNNETWRIIGIFNMPKIINDNGILTASETETEQRIKLIRDESLGIYSWDTSSLITLNQGYGANQWGSSKYTNNNAYEGADLMRELNGDYLDLTLTENTTWYNGTKNKKTATFDIKKRLNSEAQSMIDNAIWYLGGGVENLSLENQYKRERGIEGYQLGSQEDGVTRTTEWTGKIGLIYPSDYGYASANTSCKDNLGIDNQNNCKDQNWLHNNTFYWTLSPCSGFPTSVQHVQYTGYVNSTSAGAASQVRPSVYLKSGVKLRGEGTTSNPYTFS